MPTATETGYTFTGWFSAAQGGSFEGMGGALYSPASSVTLYAQWRTDPTVMVSFFDNGGIGSTSSLNGVQGSVLAIPQTPAISKPGYTFANWNTVPDGSGVTYAPGENLVLSGALNLYAQWQPLPTYVVTSSGTGTSQTFAPITAVQGSTVAIPSAPSPTSPGTIFSGWNTKADGTGLEYIPGETVVLNASLNLFAQWHSLPRLVILFRPNGGKGSLAAVRSYQGSTIRLPRASAVIRPGFTFAGWNTAPGGHGTRYAPGQTVALDASLSLFAQWHALPRFVILFRLNGGTGSLAAVRGYQGFAVRLPSAAALARPGYTFAGWNTAPGGKGALYGAGAKLILRDSLTLYARWVGDAPSTLVGAVGPFAGRATRLSAGLSQQVEALAQLIVRHRYRHVTLYGYSANVGSIAQDLLCSRRRAEAVAALLRSVLVRVANPRVTVATAGEGFTPGLSLFSSQRVEVFVQ